MANGLHRDLRAIAAEIGANRTLEEHVNNPLLLRHDELPTFTAAERWLTAPGPGEKQCVLEKKAAPPSSKLPLKENLFAFI
ncbi:hypothetical protein ACVW1C_005531 [Bradyrhizobium sp. USDA 4011]